MAGTADFKVRILLPSREIKRVVVGSNTDTVADLIAKALSEAGIGINTPLYPAQNAAESLITGVGVGVC